MNKKSIAGIGAGIILAGGGGAVVTDQLINPYTDKGQTLEVQVDSVVQDAGEIKLAVSKDEPKITLSKWNGEVALGVKSLDLPTDATGDRPFLSKNVEWTSGDVKMEEVPLDPADGMEDGGTEINLILQSEPKSNIFTFQLENFENLDFFYQPALTQEEIDGGATRPDNVVGSYAVYYKDHKNHTEGQTNYATGKAYHIYRPLVTDNQGNTTWADLNYSNGVLTVTVPQKFLDTSEYPVKVDPTFGYTSAGASFTNVATNMYGGIFTTGVAGTLTSMTVSIKTQFGNENARTAVYNGSNYLDAGEIKLITNPSQYWETFNGMTQSVSASTQYGLVLGSEFVNFGDNIYYDATGGSGIKKDGNWTVLASPPTPVTFDTNTNRYSIYATYTASATGSDTAVLQGSMVVNGTAKILTP